MQNRKMENRRKGCRIPVSFPVACDLLPQRHYFYTVCKDLSTNGIKLVTDDFIPYNHHLKLNINLIDKIIALKAKVMWCSKQRYADRYYTGLKFMEISGVDKGYLKEFVTSTKNN